MPDSRDDFTSVLRDQRSRLYSWLRNCLVGPGLKVGFESEEHNLIGLRPLERYQLGILYPIEKGVSGVDPTSELDEPEEDDVVPEGELGTDDESSVEPVGQRRRYVPPSSAGFSFFVRGRDLRLQIVPWAARYELEVHKRGWYEEGLWCRKPCNEDNCAALTDVRPPASRSTHSQRIPVFEDKAEVFVLWRPLSDGWLVTISLSNRQELPEDVGLGERLIERNKQSFFEIQLECLVESGEVGTYPSIDPSLLSEEDQELELEYQHKRIFAIGHGVAVDWEETGGRVNKIRTDFLPKVEVPQVSVDAKGSFLNALSLEFLARLPENAKSVCEELEGFVNAYEVWVSDQIDIAKALPKHKQGVAERISSRMTKAVSRMKQGVHLILYDSNASLAFGLANKAMHSQMRQHDQSWGKPNKPIDGGRFSSLFC